MTALFCFIFISYLDLLSFSDMDIHVLERFGWLFFQKKVSTSILLRLWEYLFQSDLFQGSLKLCAFSFTVFCVLRIGFLFIFPQIHRLSQALPTFLLNPLKNFHFLQFCIPCLHLVLFFLSVFMISSFWFLNMLIEHLLSGIFLLVPTSGIYLG